MAGMKGINEGYSGPMTKLQMCIGLFASVLLVSAVPAQAGTSTTIAKVCAEFKSGAKVAGVKFGWHYPAEAGPVPQPGGYWLRNTDGINGMGTTDKKGCFVSKMPIGLVAFRYGYFSVGTFSARGQSLVSISQRPHLAKVPIHGTVKFVLPDIPSQRLLSSELVARDPSGSVIVSNFEYTVVPESSGCNSESSKNKMFALLNTLVKYGDLNAESGYASDFLLLNSNVRGRAGYNWDDNSGRNMSVDISSTNIGTNDSGKVNFKVFRATYEVSDPKETYRTCITATAKFDSTEVVGYSFLTFPITTIRYTGYLPGFSGVPEVVKAKSGKATFTTTLHDDENKPITGMTVWVNPYLNKRVGSCKPVLTATTNAQGRATFTLCPTKNMTVTLKGPLGIVSPSIPVTK